MTPEQIGALRALLARATAAGWQLWRIETFGDGGWKHEYWRGANPARRWDCDQVIVERSGARSGNRGTEIFIRPLVGSEWAVPVISASQIAQVLEWAGVIPPVPQPPRVRPDAVAALERAIAALMDAAPEYDRDDLGAQPGDPAPTLPHGVDGYPLGLRHAGHDWRDCPDLAPAAEAGEVEAGEVR